MQRNRTPIGSAQSDKVRLQLSQLETFYGLEVTANLIGVQMFTLTRKTLHGSTMRAIQWTWAFTFRPTHRVSLLDIMTSFKYEIERTKCESCLYITGDGDGI